MMHLWRQRWVLFGLLGLFLVLLAACSGAPASAGGASLGNISPSRTGTPDRVTPMPCPTGMGPCPSPPGMVAPAQLVQNGHYSDERFIDMMVTHHLMAIQMAQLAQRQGEHAQIKQLAGIIITTQGQEITELKALKERLYG